MIRPRDRQTANRLDTVLMAFSKAEHPLPGIVPLNRRQTFVAQMIESMRRIEVIELLKNSPVSVACSNPKAQHSILLRRRFIILNKDREKRLFGWCSFSPILASITGKAGR